MTLREIEQLIKSVNAKHIKAIMRSAVILGDANATDEMKSQALANVRAITSGKKTKIKQSVQPIKPVDTATPQKIEYPEGLHLSPLNTHGHDEASMRGIFDALPDHEKKSISDWYASTKMTKSIDSLYNLFKELKKRL